MSKIIQTGNKVLNKEAEAIDVKQINSPKIQKIIAAMKEALDQEIEGVALAAPQIAVPLQIFVVSKKVPLITEGKELTPENLAKNQDTVYINPVIIKISRTKTKLDEGCLSVRNWFGQVKRSDKVTVSAYDETGKKFTRGGSGLLAQIFQHEIDHLNGILFTEKAENLQEIKPPTT